MHVMERRVASGPTVLMVHGNPTWGYLWRKVAAQLHDFEGHLVMPDLVGLGFSDKPTDLYKHQLDNHARWLARLVTALDLRDVVLVVQDWGGPIGVRAMMEHPERLAGVVVLNTVLGPPGEGFRPHRFHRFAQQRLVSDVAFRVLGFPQNAMFTAQGDKWSISPLDMAAYLWPLRDVRTNGAPLALARMVPDGMMHPSVEALRKVERFMAGYGGPVEVVWGDRDPVLGRARRKIEKLLPHAPITGTPAGHFLQEEVPALIAGAIRSVASAKR